MQLPVDPAKLFWMCLPLYGLMALSFALQPDSWLHGGVSVWSALGIPLLLPLLGWAARSRWKLEATPEALLHHTLTRVERYEWVRMGPVEVRWLHVLHLPVMRTLWFVYPLDAPRTASEQITARIGRRLLPVFGDRSAKATAELLESWRRLDQA